MLHFFKYYLYSLVSGEVCGGPVVERHVYLVYGLGVRAGEGGGGAPVEAAVVGQDGEAGGA